MSLFDAFFPSTFAGPEAGPASGGPAPCGCGCSSSSGDEDGDAAPGVDDPSDSAGGELLSRTLNDWVLRRPEALGIFRDLGLDACCGGQRTLGEACELHGLDPGAVLDRLRVAAPGAVG